MYDVMKSICEYEYSDFFCIPNVVGIGIGNKVTNGVDLGATCLKVLVKNKVPKKNLLRSEVIPSIYKGYITDVYETGEIFAQPNTSKIRPAPGGYSIGISTDFLAGTLGCLVKKGAGSSEKTYVLSNNHVIASNNNAPIGTLILQPSRADGGVIATDTIATLSSFVTIDFSGGNNLVDAAIAEVTNTSLVTSAIADIGNISGIASAIVGNGVRKSGRTTSLTGGVITSINTTLSVNYGSGLNATFIRQIVSTDISDAGDSGSIVLDSENRVIGLLFGGSATISAMNDIREVLKSFKARLA